MAVAIVPCDRKVGTCPEKDILSRNVPASSAQLRPQTDELLALAAELAACDQLGPVEALSHALALSEDLYTFASSWDIFAAHAGNPNVQLFATPPVVPVRSG